MSLYPESKVAKIPHLTICRNSDCHSHRYTQQHHNSNGMNRRMNNDYDHDERYTQFEIFGFGSDRYAYNTMSGELELGGRSTSIVMGDFHYETESGTGKKRSTHTHRISYVILRLPWDRIPELIVRPENIFDRLVGFLGFDDIDFESAEFSKRFMVKSKDRKFAYDLIDPRMMEYMLASDPPVFDLEHGSICMTRGVCFQNSSGFDAVLRWADGFLERWPDHVVKDIESRAT